MKEKLRWTSTLIRKKKVVRRAVEALVRDLGHVEAMRSLSLHRDRVFASVTLHRQWQDSLDKDCFFDEVLRPTELVDEWPHHLTHPLPLGSSDSTRNAIHDCLGCAPCPLQILLNPEIEQRLRRHHSFFCNLAQHLRQLFVERIVRDLSFEVNFKVNWFSLIPIVGKVMRIPEIAGLLIGTGL
jgi:hypothetical protein